MDDMFVLPGDDGTSRTDSPADVLPDVNSNHEATHIPTRRPSLEAMQVKTGENLLEIQALRLEQAAALEEALTLHAAHGRIPRGHLQSILTRTRLKSRQRLNEKMKEAIRYRAAYPDASLVEVFNSLSVGRPQAQILTPEQHEFFRQCSLKTNWGIREPGGEIKYPAKIKPSIHWLHQLLLLRFPELNGKVRVQYLQKLQDRMVQADPILFKLAWEGARTVREHFAHKVYNRTFAPDERWQLDVRYLPIYVRNGNVVCTVALLLIIDNYSRYVVDWSLLPREVETAPNELYTVDFTSHIVRSHLACVMHRSGRRPRTLYTDNGTIFKALAPFLRLFAADERTEIEHIFSIGDQPWGRGLVESALRHTMQTIKKYPGYVHHHRQVDGWRRAYAQAHKKPEALFAFEQVKSAVANDIKRWNKQPALLEGISEIDPGKEVMSQQTGNGDPNHQPTRQSVWETTPSIALAAPTLIQLALLASTTRARQASISKLGVYIGKTYYEPVSWDASTRQRWQSAAARQQAAPKGAKIVDIVWYSFVTKPEEGVQILVRLEGDYWEPVQKKGTQQPSPSQHVQGREQAIRNVQAQVAKAVEGLEQGLVTYLGNVPVQDWEEQIVLPGQETVNPMGGSGEEHSATAEIHAAIAALPFDDTPLSALPEALTTRSQQLVPNDGEIEAVSALDAPRKSPSERKKKQRSAPLAQKTPQNPADQAPPPASGIPNPFDAMEQLP